LGSIPIKAFTSKATSGNYNAGTCNLKAYTAVQHRSRIQHLVIPMMLRIVEEMRMRGASIATVSVGYTG
jgi:hypothetical protein